MSMDTKQETATQKKEPVYYASIPIDFQAAAKKITQHIEKEDLDVKPGKSAVESQHHISVHVLLPSLPNEQLTQKLSGCKNFKIQIQGLGCFENKDKDVLYARVDAGPQSHLFALHRFLVYNYKKPWQHETYTPHVTLAYLKPGTGKKYLDMPLGPLTTVDATELQFREHGGDNKLHTTIKL